jgi:hypothetical protein
MAELRTGKTTVAPGVTIVPIERCFMQSGSGNMGCWLSGLKEPYAILVSDADGIRAFDTMGRGIPVESLVQEIPALGTVTAFIRQKQGLPEEL